MKQVQTKKSLSKAAFLVTDHFKGRGRFTATYRLPVFLSLLIAATAGAARGEGVTPEESATWNGNVPDGGALIDSGEHVFNSGLNIGGKANSEPLRISCGKVKVTAGDVKIANYIYQSNAKGELVVDGTGEFEALNSNVLLPSDPNGTGRLTVAGQGVVHIKELANKFNNRVGYITLSDQGRLTIDSDNTAVAQGGNGGVVFNISTSDQSYFKSPKFQFGDNGADVVHASFNGGTIDASGKEWIAKSGKGSTFVFGGATATIGQMTVEGQSAQDYTNAVEVAGGTVTFNSLPLRAPTGRNVMLLVSGGTLYLPCKPQIGESEGSGEAIFRQTGGTVVVDKETDLNPKAGTHSTFELLGGIYRGRHIRGLQGSPWAGGTGATTVRADGGTLAPSTAYNSGNNELIYKVPEVRLGAKGLTIDSEGHNPSVCAKFADDGEGVSGKFVKTGSGTLTVNLKETNGGSGEYGNGRSLNSSHAFTVVNGGTMLLANQSSDGYCQFGKSVSVIDGAVLSLKGSGVTKLVVDDLTLGKGKGTSYSTIAMDSGDEIEIGSSLAANVGAIDASWITGDGEYTIFTCAKGVTVDQSVLDNIVLLNPPAGKDYIWVTYVDEETGVTTCSIKVGDEGTLGPKSSSIVYTNGVGVVDPDGSADPVGSISGYGSAQDDLNLHRVASATVDENNTLTLGGALTGGGRTTLTKTGPGKLTITGDNSETYRGGFAVDGGILSIEDQSALGSVGLLTKNLTLKSGTLALEGGDMSGVEPITLTIATGENKKPAIVDVAKGASLTAQNIVHQTGALVKKGAGELSLDLGEGSYTIVKNNGNENNNTLISLPVTGDSPSDTSALSALTVLEGALRIQGEGADKTTVHANDPVLIGGRYAGVAPSVLALNDVTMTTDNHHISFGRNVPAGGRASALYMTNSVFRTNKLEFGHDGSADPLEYVLDMKDSTLVDNYKIQFCWGNAAARITADNSVIECTGDNGLMIGRVNSAVFTGEQAAFRATKADGTGNAGRLLVYNSNFSEGAEVRFEDGARLVTTRGVRYQNNDSSKGFLATVFDNGIFEVRASTAELNCRSRMAQPQKQGFTVDDGGLEIAIAESVGHYITFPIRGEGSVVKTGEGVLYLTESYNLNTPSTEKLLQYTGGTVVSNGTLVVDGSLVDGAKSFEVAKGATLDLNETTLAGATIAGAGVVTNGTLSAATLAYDSDALPTFSGVSFKGALIVDFGRTEDNPLDIDKASAGISIARYTGEAPVNLRVKTINTGIQRARAAVDFVGGEIVMKVDQTGFLMIVR